MSLFVSEIVTPPAGLPIAVDTAQDDLARAVVEEIERGILWRAIVSQERRIVIDGTAPAYRDRARDSHRQPHKVGSRTLPTA